MTDLFANVNDGDYVRVEFKDGAMEGTMTTEGAWDGFYNEIAYRSIEHLAEVATKVTVLRRALPPEPAPRSVVLDAFDIAWQHAGAGTWLSTDDIGGRIWPNLDAERGPLRVIYTPEGK